jgi:hypothetical protein
MRVRDARNRPWRTAQTITWTVSTGESITCHVPMTGSSHSVSRTSCELRASRRQWPAEGSGFDPSNYSPARQLCHDAQISSNLSRDPGGVWRAIKGGWGLWIIIGGVLLVVVVVALISAVL